MDKESEKKGEKILLDKIEDYLRDYPSASGIEYFQNMLKLTYTYSTPYTDSKNSKQVLLPLADLSVGTLLENANPHLSHNSQKGRIQQTGTFDSITTKGKHEKVLQDDIFGNADISTDGNRWVYIAEIKQEEVKSYFNQGKGKAPYKHDFGQTMEGIREAAIFVWDKNRKIVVRIPIEKNLIPCYVTFANKQGTELIFHAYEVAHFGHGLLFCFNRKVGIFHAKYQLPEKQQKKQCSKEGEMKSEEKAKEDKKKDQAKAEVIQLFKEDKNRTKIFAKTTPCFNYLMYLSGTGQTHTFYKDVVICQHKQGSWIETHRIEGQMIGYNSTLKPFMVEQEGKYYCIMQSGAKSCGHLYKIDLQNGQISNLTQTYKNHVFVVSQVYQNVLVGNVSTNNFNSFFYLQNGKVKIIEPPTRQNFVEEEYSLSIHSVLVAAREEDIWNQFRFRLKNRPLLVMPHGGPHGSFAHAFSCFRYMALKMGYYLLHPNFSGSAGYGKAHLEGSLGKVGEQDANQIIQVINKVLNDHSDIDRKKVHTQGGSYGGYMSAIFASRHSDLFRSATILNGVIDLISNMWFSDIPEWGTVEALGHGKIHELTQQDYQAFWRQSPSNQPMKIPILQILGAKDRRVPWRQGLFLDAITKSHGTEITTYVYENSGHSLSDSVETSMDIIVKMLLFLESWDEESPVREKKEQKLNE